MEVNLFPPSFSKGLLNAPLSPLKVSLTYLLAREVVVLSSVHLFLGERPNRDQESHVSSPFPPSNLMVSPFFPHRIVQYVSQFWHYTLSSVVPPRSIGLGKKLSRLSPKIKEVGRLFPPVPFIYNLSLINLTFLFPLSFPSCC